MIHGLTELSKLRAAARLLRCAFAVEELDRANASSKRVLEKLGMRFIGSMRPRSRRAGALGAHGTAPALSCWSSSNA